jgi:hypothetical protein
MIHSYLFQNQPLNAKLETKFILKQEFIPHAKSNINLDILEPGIVISNRIDFYCLAQAVVILH